MCNCTMNIYNKLYISIFQHQTNETKRFVQNALYPSAHTALACRWRNNREGGGGRDRPGGALFKNTQTYFAKANAYNTNTGRREKKTGVLYVYKNICIKYPISLYVIYIFLYVNTGIMGHPVSCILILINREREQERERER